MRIHSWILFDKLLLFVAVFSCINESECLYLAIINLLDFVVLMLLTVEMKCRVSSAVNHFCLWFDAIWNLCSVSVPSEFLCSNQSCCMVWVYFVHLNFQHIKIKYLRYLFLFFIFIVNISCGSFVFQSRIHPVLGFWWHMCMSHDLLLL